MTFEIQPTKILRFQLFLVLVLLAANVAGIVLRHSFHVQSWYRAFELFDFDAEQNIPTLYSSITLAICAAFLGAIGATYKKSGGSYLPWLGLAAVFLFLSVDETAAIHEQLSVSLQSRFDTSGVFYFAWMIPYGLGLLMILGLYSRFLVQLPKGIMLLFLLAGAIYISGAIGLEAVFSYYRDFFEERKLLGGLVYTCEDLFEMIGVALFIYTLLSYIQTQFGQIRLTVGKSR